MDRKALIEIFKGPGFLVEEVIGIAHELGGFPKARVLMQGFLQVGDGLLVFVPGVKVEAGGVVVVGRSGMGKSG
jgi:hypothetical protein